METKLSQLLKLMQASDWSAAIRFASKFPNLGKQRDDIKRANDSIQNPDFYRQIKLDPDLLFESGVAALKSRYWVS